MPTLNTYGIREGQQVVCWDTLIGVYQGPDLSRFEQTVAMVDFGPASPFKFHPVSYEHLKPYTEEAP